MRRFYRLQSNQRHGVSILRHARDSRYVYQEQEVDRAGRESREERQECKSRGPTDISDLLERVDAAAPLADLLSPTRKDD